MALFEIKGANGAESIPTGRPAPLQGRRRKVAATTVVPVRHTFHLAGSAAATATSPAVPSFNIVKIVPKKQRLLPLFELAGG